jgi:hypothetical protein
MYFVSFSIFAQGDIDLKVKDLNNCNQNCNCLILSPKVIKNKKISNITTSYIYNKVYSGNCKILNENILFNNTEFKQLIEKIFIEKISLEFEEEEYRFIWNDRKIGLLFGLTPKKVRFEIIDNLLLKDNNVGLSVIWSEIKKGNLKNFQIYSNRKRNHLELFEIAAIYHNLKEFNNRDKIIRRISSLAPSKEIINFKKIISNFKFIDYNLFEEKILFQN